MMGGSKQQQVCMKCTKKCLTIHGKSGKRQPSSSSVAAVNTQISFFKIMIGDFKEAMSLPPKVAHTFRDLVHEDTYLEDSNGRTWKVRISTIAGSLAFRQGWRNFIIDHNVKHGELVVFKYTRRSIFSVQIFATSACERLNFTVKHNRQYKRKRSKAIYIPSGKNARSVEQNYPGNDDSEKQDMALAPLHEGIQIAAVNHVAEVAGNMLNAHVEPPHFDHSIMLQSKSVINYRDAPCDTNAEHALKVKEAVEIPLTDLCNNEDVIDSRNKHTSFSDNDKSKSCLVRHAGDKKEDLVASNMLISNYPLSEEHTSIVQYSEAPHNMIPQSSMLEEPGTNETQFHSQGTERLFVDVDENEQLYPHDSLRRSQAMLVAEYTIPVTKNQIEDCWAVVTNPLSGKELSTVDRINERTLSAEDWIRKQELENIFDLFKHETDYSMLDAEEMFSSSPPFDHNKCTEDEGGNLNIQNQAVGKRDISDQETGYNADYAIMNTNESHRDYQTSLCDPEVDGTVHLADEAAIKTEIPFICEDNVEVHTGEPISVCIENVNTMSFVEPRNNGTRTRENWGILPTNGSGLEDASMVESVGSDPMNITGRSEYPKYPVNKERDSNQTEVEDKNIDLCLQEKAIVPKTEIMDSIDFPSPSNTNFRFSVTVNAQAWLKLPERLPSSVVRKKLERRVVTLRDPSMRIWPTLYHESIRFVGFISGWEEFATANNLQIGDICQFELANELEPTFQLRSSGASK